MLAWGVVAALVVIFGTALALTRRHHSHDDFGPSVQDYAAFRAALAAADRRDEARI